MSAKFLRDRSGATAIEYGLMLALISLAILGAITLLGQNLATTLSNIASFFSNTATGTP